MIRKKIASSVHRPWVLSGEWRRDINQIAIEGRIGGAPVQVAENGDLEEMIEGGAASY